MPKDLVDFGADVHQVQPPLSACIRFPPLCTSPSWQDLADCYFGTPITADWLLSQQAALTTTAPRLPNRVACPLTQPKQSAGCENLPVGPFKWSPAETNVGGCESDS